MAEVAPDDLRHCERSEAIQGHKQGWIARFAPRKKLRKLWHHAASAVR